MSRSTDVPGAKVTVSLRRVLAADVEIEDPDDGDEIAWYDEVERRAWDTQDRSGAWRTTHEENRVRPGRPVRMSALVSYGDADLRAEITDTGEGSACGGRTAWPTSGRRSIPNSPPPSDAWLR